ncbi:MAG: 5-methyltetrahydropteroyltriglutamate--homocysteine methyltransferase, partial [Holdemanella biformis]|nr:5-methyltetrahydropteroyltriglutamate--homocysteine methyltransferase [Holdemanella biformis]
MTVQTPYRYDVVGSFLRPEKLKQARKDYEAKKISKEELTKVEDACITDLIQKEKA